MLKPAGDRAQNKANLHRSFTVAAGLRQAGISWATGPRGGTFNVKELPGVGASFYLSGYSRMYAATGDERFLARVNHMVDELERCQQANGNGYLLATRAGKRIFAEIEHGDIRFEGGWLLNGEAEPYYALEKLFSGLRDAWRVAGVHKALEISVRLGDWLDGHKAHLTDAGPTSFPMALSVSVR
jgi:DUF1680 family protein